MAKSSKWGTVIPFASKEYTYLCMLTILRESNLASYITNLSMKAYINDTSHQEFHCSLRLKNSDNWYNINNLYQKKKFQKMPGIPITFPLPYDGKTWRNYRDLMKRIILFREGFMRIEQTSGLQAELPHAERQVENIPMKRSQIVRSLNQNKDITSRKEVYEAYGDFLLFTEDSAEEDSDWIPYLHLQEEVAQTLQIIN